MKTDYNEKAGFFEAPALPTADDLVRRAVEIAPALRAEAEATERQRRVSPKIIQMFRDAGFFKLLQPARFGGFERSFSDLVRIDIELGQGCGSAAWCASLGMVHQWFVSLFPLQAQEEVWEDRDSILAGSYAPNGECRKTSGGFLVSGRWSYASNCDNADWFMIGVMLPAAEGQTSKHAILLVPRAEAVIEDTWYVAGLAGTGSKTIVIEDPTFVPEHRMLLREEMVSGDAPGAKVHANAIYKIPFYAALPFSLASPIIGMAQGAVDVFTSWARGPKAQLPYVQMNLAEASAAVDTAKLLIQQRVAMVEAAIAERPLSIDERIRNRRDQAYSARLAVRAIDVLVESLSASGFDLSSALQRYWRDIHTAAHHVSLHWKDVGLLYGQHRLALEPRGNY